MKHRILFVDDDLNTLDAYQRTLGSKYHVDIAASGQQALRLISTQKPYAVIVSDMIMPGISGLELCEQAMTLSPESTRIMLTGNASQDVAINAVNQGHIFQFLLKPCTNNELIQSLQLGINEYELHVAEKNKLANVVEIANDLSQKLEHQANYDALTDLMNRNEFDSRIKQTLECANRDTTEHTLLVIDIDQFNVINQAYGRPVGDILLKYFASQLKKYTREKDIIARIGADEFGILLDYCSTQNALKVVSNIKKSLSDTPFKWKEQLFHITLSIGLAKLTKVSNNDVLCMTEEACSVAKEHGGNRLHKYSPGDGEIAKRQSSVLWVTKINKAINENRFSLYFQPIVPIWGRTTNKNRHYEILLRMLDEESQIIPPGKFLPVAERHNLITRLDRWVINAVLTWLAQNPMHVEQLQQCGINLSGQTLGDAETLDFIIDKFREFDISPEKIYFEITESAAIANMANAVEFINTLKQLGCSFALDDFGTGLSSFGYLRELPVDYIKIDGIFVKEIDKNPVDVAVVSSICDIGHAMNKKVIAEFVESDSILKKLAAIGVDYAQGYGISAPRPVDEILICDEETGAIENTA